MSWFTHTPQAGQFALSLNNIIQLNSVFNAEFASCIITSNVPNSLLQLVNNTNTTNTIVQYGGVGNSTPINAYIIIEKFE